MIREVGVKRDIRKLRVPLGLAKTLLAWVVFLCAAFPLVAQEQADRPEQTPPPVPKEVTVKK